LVRATGAPVAATWQIKYSCRRGQAGRREKEKEKREERRGKRPDRARGACPTTTWFERKPDFFEHPKRPKFFILGKFCTHTPGGQGPRAHLIWAIN
jgi:hypothetical protein